MNNVENNHWAYQSAKITDILGLATMNNSSTLSLIRLTRRVEVLECSLYAINYKLDELEVENAAHSERYTTLLERREVLQESLEIIQGCIRNLRKSLH
jgi:hypothetical protein